MAYKLQLPSELKIHHVFHVSQLKQALGSKDHSVALPPVCIGDVLFELEPEELVEKRYNASGELELLVKWANKEALENSWMLYAEFVSRFPDFKLEDKLGFVGGSIDRYQRAYFRRKKNKEVEADVAGVVGNGLEVCYE